MNDSWDCIELAVGPNRLPGSCDTTRQCHHSASSPSSYLPRIHEFGLSIQESEQSCHCRRNLKRKQWKKMAFSDIDAHSNTHSIHLSDHNPEDQRLDCILGIVWIRWMACALCALQVCANPKTNWRTIFVKVIDGALTATEESHSVTFAHCPSAPLDIPHLDSQTCCEHPM